MTEYVMIPLDELTEKERRFIREAEERGIPRRKAAELVYWQRVGIVRLDGLLAGTPTLPQPVSAAPSGS